MSDIMDRPSFPPQMSRGNAIPRPSHLPRGISTLPRGGPNRPQQPQQLPGSSNEDLLPFQEKINCLQANIDYFEDKMLTLCNDKARLHSFLRKANERNMEQARQIDYHSSSDVANMREILELRDVVKKQEMEILRLREALRIWKMKEVEKRLKKDKSCQVNLPTDQNEDSKDGDAPNLQSKDEKVKNLGNPPKNDIEPPTTAALDIEPEEEPARRFHGLDQRKNANPDQEEQVRTASKRQARARVEQSETRQNPARREGRSPRGNTNRRFARRSGCQIM